MTNQNPIYGIFNQSYIESQYRKQHDIEQVQRTMDCANKLKDFLESIDQVEPAFQNMASEQCLAILIKYIKKHGMS